jgi:8-oxo-dGTP diphosphatase
LPIELFSPKDLDIEIDVAEDGRSPQENACKKARAYWAASNLPTLAVDAGLTIARLDQERQPGVYVKRIHRTGQEVTDREVLAHYVRELDRVGGESAATWQVALALMVSENEVFTRTFALEVLLTTREQGPLRTGEPLTVLMVDPATDKHYTEMTYGERPDSRQVLSFVSECLDEIGEKRD